ncbi:MAG TPA: RDD family protein, partial [Chloroflexota bacterium]|nr:RDD family protein [Chloroflexota bacterium]
GGWDGPTPSLYDDGVGPPSPVAALAGQHAYPKASPAPRPFPAQPLAYQIDPATGLPFDPHFQPDPLPAVRAAGTPVPFFPRFGALLVDYCILSVLWFGAVGFAAVIDSPAFGLLASLFGPALYFIIFWAMGGRTPGYRAAGLQLVHTDGSRVGLGASIVRYVGSLISWPLFCLGYLWMLWDPQAQTWHDKMADTTVIHS